MEKSTPLGLLAGLILIVTTVLSGGDWNLFLDLQSVIIVLGGTAVTLVLSFTISELKRVGRASIDFFKYREPELEQLIPEFAEYSRIAHRDGLLALDRHLSEQEGSISRFGLELAIDGIDEHQVADLIGVRMHELTYDRRLLAKFFSNAGAYAPAFGMIGTLIGLIQMLHNMNNPGVIGPAMSVAIITTFYGALLANLFFLPLATKVRTQISSLQKQGDMIRAGVLAVLHGESPSMVERRLYSYLQSDATPPARRDSDISLVKAAA